MANIKDIKNKLITIVQGVQFSGGDAFVGVYGYPIDNLTAGYPVAIVLLDGGESEFDTNRSYERTETFEVTIVVALEDGDIDKSDAFDHVYDLMDSVRNGIDQTYDLDGTTLHMNPSVNDVSIGVMGSGMNAFGRVSVEVRHLFKF